MPNLNKILWTLDFTPSTPPELKSYSMMVRKLYEQLARAFNGMVDVVNTSGIGSFVDSQALSGTINGVNTIFFLPDAPSPITSLLLFQNGILDTQGIDYVLSGNKITFTTAPAIGDSLVTWYRK